MMRVALLITQEALQRREFKSNAGFELPLSLQTKSGSEFWSGSYEAKLSSASRRHHSREAELTVIESHGGMR